jgi:hypothetical protein
LCRTLVPAYLTQIHSSESKTNLFQPNPIQSVHASPH